MFGGIEIMLSLAMLKKINGIMDIVKKDIIHISDKELGLIRKTLIEEFTNDKIGASLEQSVVEEVEYMLNEGLLYNLAEELGIKEDEIERVFKENLGTIPESICARVHIHDIIEEEIKSHFEGD